MRLFNPTGRNTECRILAWNKTVLYFSYETCIAIDTKNGKRLRLANTWGPTTGRHFDESGCSDFTRVSQATFDRVLKGELK